LIILIHVYTKKRHISKIEKYLDCLKIENKIFTVEDKLEVNKFDLGVSYCYPRKIIEPLLSIPQKGFINYHPGPLPKYKGPNEFEEAIKNQETKWGVSVHYMNKEYDSGKIIKIKEFKLHEPPNSIQEIGAISHYFLFQLFKETIKKLYNKIN
jgi:methionyl-tRNA formyltransferase